MKNLRVECTSINVRGLRTTSAFCVTKIQVLTDTDLNDFNTARYTLTSLFFTHRGLAVYVKRGLYRNSVNAPFRIFTAFIYRRPNLTLSCTYNEFDKMSDTITKLMISFPKAEIALVGALISIKAIGFAILKKIKGGCLCGNIL